MEEILNYLNNYFFSFKQTSNFSILNGEVEVKGYHKAGQYVMIKGSALNDGIYEVITTKGNKILINDVLDEEFEGVIYSLAVPRALTKLEIEIRAYKEKYKFNPYVSESFGNYSYTLGKNKNGESIAWKDAFKSELRPYRKSSNGMNYVKEVV